MKKTKILFFIFTIAAIISMAFSTFASTDGNTVYILTIDGEITPAMASFLESNIEKANLEGADAIIIEMTTLGGRVDSATKIRDAIIASNAPVTVYVESRAISAGALITIAAKNIIMAPGSHMGAAKPSPDDPKTVAYVRGEFSTTAELTGRDPLIAQAMVDESIVIEGLVKEGEILDITANQALSYGYADHIASGRDEVLDALDLKGSVLILEEPNFRYKIAQFLTSYEVSSLLLSIGMIALVAELYTQGFGISGIIGIVCFVLYFSGNFIAGYTDYWAIGLFAIGIILLTIEITIPEFGVFGISGIVAVILSIIIAAPDIRQGVFTLMIAITATVISVPILIKLFGKTKLYSRIVLTDMETVERGYVHSPARSHLLGKEGVTLTMLRPAGTIRIDGQRIDAITQGEFIETNSPVKVIQVDGYKVIVTKNK